MSTVLSLDDSLIESIKTSINSITVEGISNISVYSTRFNLIDFDELTVSNSVSMQSNPSVWLQLFDRRQEKTTRTVSTLQDVIYIRVYVFMPGNPSSDEDNQKFNLIAERVLGACRNCSFGKHWIRNDYMQIENGGDKNTIESREGILIYAFDSVFNFFLDMEE